MRLISGAHFSTDRPRSVLPLRGQLYAKYRLPRAANANLAYPGARARFSSGSTESSTRTRLLQTGLKQKSNISRIAPVRDAYWRWKSTMMPATICLISARTLGFSPGIAILLLRTLGQYDLISRLIAIHSEELALHL